MRLLSCMLLGAAVLIVPAWTAAGPPDARCTCRNRDGSKHALGAVVCLSVDGRKYLARCEMVLNVTSWQKVQDGCPLAATVGPIPSMPYDVQ